MYVGAARARRSWRSAIFSAEAETGEDVGMEGEGSDDGSGVEAVEA